MLTNEKAESVLENEMHNILLDFELQTDHTILARLSINLLYRSKEKIYSEIELIIY